jgi:hypothetical protein
VLNDIRCVEHETPPMPFSKGWNKRTVEDALSAGDAHDQTNCSEGTNNTPPARKRVTVADLCAVSDTGDVALYKSIDLTGASSSARGGASSTILASDSTGCSTMPTETVTVR